MLHRHLPSKLASAALCVALGIGFAQAADEQAYEMTSYTNGPGGTKVMTGDYAAAITAASPHARSRDPIEALIASTNLCVSHTVRREFSAAAAACDRAYQLARRDDGRRIISVGARTAMAKALNNRGVLKALSGETAEAVTDFRKAAQIGSSTRNAAYRNLAYLEASDADALRMARTSD